MKSKEAPEDRRTRTIPSTVPGRASDPQSRGPMVLRSFSPSNRWATRDQWCENSKSHQETTGVDGKTIVEQSRDERKREATSIPEKFMPGGMEFENG